MTYQGIRRKAFVSQYKGDATAVQDFIDKWAYEEGVFIPKQLGVYDDEDFINSSDTAYVMQQIKKKYLNDSTVTIVLLGTCTHSRRYIDWEIKASLQQGEATPSGLLGIVLPSLSNAPNLPNRFALNWSNDEECYAEYHWSPRTAEQLGQWIEDAYQARTNKAHLIQNPQDMMKYNSKCKVCGVTH
jgi:hypothetical protein